MNDPLLAVIMVEFQDLGHAILIYKDLFEQFVKTRHLDNFHLSL